MFTPKEMRKVLVVAPKNHLESVIKELYFQNLFHIEEYVDKDEEEYTGFKIGMPLSKASASSTELLKLRAITNAIMVNEEDVFSQEKVSSAQLKSQIEQELPSIEEEVESLIGRRSRLETEAKDIEQIIDTLEPFADIAVDLDLLRGYETLAVFAGYLPAKLDLDVPHEEIFSGSKSGNLFIAWVPVEHRNTVERAILDAQFQAIPIPDESGLAKDRISHYKGQLSAIDTDLEELDQKLKSLRENHQEFLVACDELLTADVEMAEAPLRFATTENAFLAEGWIPAADVGMFMERMSAATAGKAFATELTIDRENDAVPVEYNNIAFAKPTEFLMDIYSRPSYTEIDPTLMVAIVFPIFFGLILGDVGYGALVLAVSLGLRKLITGKEGRMLLNILRNAGIASIIFGFLYSEFLGFPIPGLEPLLPNRHLAIGGHGGGHGPAVPELMMMTVWIGILHITVGRVLGIVNHARLDHGKHRTLAVLANLGWLLAMYGILIAALTIFALPLMPDLTGGSPIVLGLTLPAIIGLIMLVVGLLFIVRDSVLELVELPTILSHVLSYARIVGVGLSSVAIAGVVNFIAIGMFIEPQLEHLTALGVVIIIVGVVVFLIGHIFNTILGMLGGALQSMRLQYVEFFTKFYKGGGKKYNPFGMIKKFSED
ncbi:MAG TPA: V-type ATP synthase subunit I [Methanoregulaceae archaeon]|nr:V-type ATP synthase subunit I [Methanoregulaceae archaeon]